MHMNARKKMYTFIFLLIKYEITYCRDKLTSRVVY